MRFGSKDICIVGFIGILAGCYLVKVSRDALDNLPFSHYLMAIVGAVAALFIILMIKPLIKQESPD
jgi:uncharacterized membrane protein YeaQ/YmgE (transglycosylase-associated protein family)